MPKYQKGDVASLFPAPKAPKSESGKKLLALFSEFHSKKSRPQIQSPIQQSEKIKKNEKEIYVAEEKIKASQSPLKRKKKRKFPEEDSQACFQQAAKKFKPELPEPKSKVPLNTSNSEIVEIDFPRRKKKQKNFSQTPFVPPVTEGDDDYGSDFGQKSSPFKGFVKKSKSKKSKGNEVVAKAKNFKIDGDCGLVSPAKALSNSSLVESYSSDSEIQVITPESIKKFNAKNKNKEKHKKVHESIVREDSGDLVQEKNVDSDFGQTSTPFKGFVKKSKSNKSNGDSEIQVITPESIKKFNAKNKNKEKHKKVHESIVKEDSSDLVQGKNVDSDFGQTSIPFKGFVKKSKSNKSKGNEVVAKAKNFKIDGDSGLVSPPKYKALSNSSLVKSYSSDSEIQVITPKSIKKFNAKNKEKHKKVHENIVREDSSDLVQGKNVDPNQPDFIRLPSHESPVPLKMTRIHQTENEDIKTFEDYTSEEALSRTLFVGNLPTDASRKSLKNLFSVYGNVQHIRYHPFETDRRKIFQNYTKVMTSRNYAANSIPAYIVFKERQSAEKALALSGSVFQNRHITVDFATPAGTHKLYDNKRSIFIGNLPFGVEEESIWRAFAECGKIESVRAVRHSATGVGKGFGYVLFSNIQGKEKALSLGEMEIDGRKIRIRAVESNKKYKSYTPEMNAERKLDPFKSRAIKKKKSLKDSQSRKSINKIMKKNKMLHNKKKVAALLQKSMA